MSRNIKSWVMLALATLIASMLTWLVSSPASAVPGDPIIPDNRPCVMEVVTGDPATAPPPPTCYDPLGSDEDEFLVPLDYGTDNNGYGIAYVDQDWNQYWTDRPNPTNGASQVLVQSMYYDPSVGGYVPGHAWMLHFDTQAVSAPEPNTYWVSIGDCLESGVLGRRAVTAYVRNDVSASGRYLGSVYPEADAIGVTVSATQPASRVYDGSTVAIPMVAGEYNDGLFTGYTYTVNFWTSDVGVAWDDSIERTLAQTMSVYVPACDDTTTPTDPATPTPPPPTTTPVRPRAKILVNPVNARYRQVTVVLGSQPATKSTSYRVVLNPPRGRTVRRTYVTPFRTLTYPSVRKGTVVKVRWPNHVIRKRV